MYKKTISFVDFDGNTRSEDFYFYLSKAELLRLNFSYGGGFENTMKAIINERDQTKLYEIFEKIVFESYGRRSADGKYFEKIDSNGNKLANEFIQTEAYSNLIMELLTVEGASAEFINGIIPKDLQQN